MFRLPKNDGAGRRRFSPVALISGVVATVILALTTTGTLAAFTAQITNSVNAATTGSLVMQETVGTTTCLSSDENPVKAAGATITGTGTSDNNATCTSINDYGVTPLTPGGTQTTTVVIKNVGTVAASTFTLTPGLCTAGIANTAIASGTADICGNLVVSISATISGSTTVVSVTGSGVSTPTTINGKTYTIAAIPAGSFATFTVTTTLISAENNSFQNRTITQPFVWAFAV